jgi:hypothetical protein
VCVAGVAQLAWAVCACVCARVHAHANPEDRCRLLVFTD